MIATFPDICNALQIKQHSRFLPQLPNSSSVITELDQLEWITPISHKSLQNNLLLYPDSSGTLSDTTLSSTLHHSSTSSGYIQTQYENRYSQGQVQIQPDSTYIIPDIDNRHGHDRVSSLAASLCSSNRLHESAVCKIGQRNQDNESTMDTLLPSVSEDITASRKTHKQYALNNSSHNESSNCDTLVKVSPDYIDALLFSTERSDDDTPQCDGAVCMGYIRSAV